MGGILLYVIGIIFHWLYCQVSLFYRNIPLSKCSAPFLYSAFLDIRFAFLSVLGASVLQKSMYRWEANSLQIIAQRSTMKLAWMEPRGIAPAFHASLQSSSQNFSLSSLANFWSHWGQGVFQSKCIKITGSDICLRQEVENITKCLVHSQDRNYDK